MNIKDILDSLKGAKKSVEIQGDMVTILIDYRNLHRTKFIKNFLEAIQKKSEI